MVYRILFFPPFLVHFFLALCISVLVNFIVFVFLNLLNILYEFLSFIIWPTLLKLASSFLIVSFEIISLRFLCFLFYYFMFCFSLFLLFPFPISIFMFYLERFVCPFDFVFGIILSMAGTFSFIWIYFSFVCLFSLNNRFWILQSFSLESFGFSFHLSTISISNYLQIFFHFWFTSFLFLITQPSIFNLKINNRINPLL